MDIPQFENRKKNHIELSMNPDNQAVGFSGLENIELIHEALPDLDFEQISTETSNLNKKLKTPLYVNSMTAGHGQSTSLNAMIAEVCQERGWMMGVGSQRRELLDPDSAKEWKTLRESAPQAMIIGNIGIAQLIQSETAMIQRLVDNIQAQAMFVHLNALQECLQPEGTPQFTGGYAAIERLCESLSVPVVIKETGCGFSAKTLKKLSNLGVHAVDVSGLGGTHWGRIEGARSGEESYQYQAAKTFQNWGIGTMQSLLNGLKNTSQLRLWASGGVRTGLDAAKLLAVGAQAVGFAKPALEQALKSQKDLDNWMAKVEFELKVAMFCTGSKDINELKNTDWQVSR